MCSASQKSSSDIGLFPSGCPLRRTTQKTLLNTGTHFCLWQFHARDEREVDIVGYHSLPECLWFEGQISQAAVRGAGRKKIGKCGAEDRMRVVRCNHAKGRARCFGIEMAVRSHQRVHLLEVLPQVILHRKGAGRCHQSPTDGVNNGSLKSSRRRLSCDDMAGWLMPNCSAAAETLSLSSSASRARRSPRSRCFISKFLIPSIQNYN